LKVEGMNSPHPVEGATRFGSNGSISSNQLEPITDPTGLQIGDYVRLLSGSPVLKVVDFPTEEQVKVTWERNGALDEAIFPSVCLDSILDDQGEALNAFNGKCPTPIPIPNSESKLTR